MRTHHVRPALAGLLLAVTAACAPQRLYVKSREAYAKGDLATAIAYDRAVDRDGRALPRGWDDERAARHALWLRKEVAALGAHDASNAAAHAAALRGLLADARERRLEAVALPVVRPGLEAVAGVRWPEVEKLAAAGRHGEAAALGEQLVEDLEPASRFRKGLAAVRADGARRAAAAAELQDPVARALRNRLLRQLDPSRPVDAAAETAVRERHGFKVDLQAAGDCLGLADAVRAAIPAGGASALVARLGVSSCDVRDLSDAARRAGEYEVKDIVVEKVPVMEQFESCREKTSYLGQICRTETEAGGWVKQICSPVTDTTTSCRKDFKIVERSEERMRTRTLVEAYDVALRRTVADVALELRLEADGQLVVLPVRASAGSSWQEQYTTRNLGSRSFDDAARRREVAGDLRRQVADTVAQAVQFLQAKRSRQLREDAARARAAGENPRAEGLLFLAALADASALPALADALAPSGVSADMAKAAVAAGPLPVPATAALAPKLPAVPLDLSREDARAIRDSYLLTAERRSMNQTGIAVGAIALEPFGTDGKALDRANGFEVFLGGYSRIGAVGPLVAQVRTRFGGGKGLGGRWFYDIEGGPSAGLRLGPLYLTGYAGGGLDGTSGATANVDPLPGAKDLRLPMAPYLLWGARGGFVFENPLAIDLMACKARRLVDKVGAKEEDRAEARFMWALTNGFGPSLTLRYAAYALDPGSPFRPMASADRLARTFSVLVGYSATAERAY
ncbi:MAG: hypothetical protein U0229_04635 [Anaeromyxobacter sp.]